MSQVGQLVLHADTRRTKAVYSGFTRRSGILVRAFDEHGRPANVDIVELDRESLLAWLRSRGGSNPWAENCVLMLLGHEVPPA